MSDPVTFRSRGGVILAASALVVSGAALIWLGITDGVAGLARWSWPLLAMGWLVWLLYIRPKVVITEAFVEIVNPLRTHRVPWGDVSTVDSRYALTITTNSGTVLRAWAAPAPGARQALSTRREEVARTPGDEDTRRPSDAEGTTSGDATTLVRRALESYRRNGGASRPGGTDSSWAWPLLVVTVAISAAAVVSLS